MAENLEHYRHKLDGLDLQINGEKPEREDAPGLKSEVKSLKSSRTHLLHGLQVAWVVLTGIGGLLVAVFFKK
jgi:hypothetical protein